MAIEPAECSLNGPDRSAPSAKSSASRSSSNSGVHTTRKDYEWAKGRPDESSMVERGTECLDIHWQLLSNWKVQCIAPLEDALHDLVAFTMICCEDQMV